MQSDFLAAPLGYLHQSFPAWLAKKLPRWELSPLTADRALHRPLRRFRYALVHPSGRQFPGPVVISIRCHWLRQANFSQVRHNVTTELLSAGYVFGPGRPGSSPAAAPVRPPLRPAMLGQRFYLRIRWDFGEVSINKILESLVILGPGPGPFFFLRGNSRTPVRNPNLRWNLF